MPDVGSEIVDCSERVDDFYQSESYCPTPVAAFRAIAFLNLLFLVCGLFLIPLYMLRAWRGGRTGNAIWSHAFPCIWVGMMFTLPGITARALWTMPDFAIARRPVIHSFWIVGYCMWFYGAGIAYNLEATFAGIKVVLAVNPREVARWRKKLSIMSIVLVTMSWTAVVSTGVMLETVHPRWREHVIAFYTLSISLTLFLAEAKIGRPARKAMDLVIVALPSETPERIRANLSFARTSMALVQVTFVALGIVYACIAMVPPLRKNAGFIINYVLLTLSAALCDTVTAIYAHRERERASAELFARLSTKRRRTRPPMQDIVDAGLHVLVVRKYGWEEAERRSARKFRPSQRPLNLEKLQEFATTEVWRRGVRVEFLDDFMEDYRPEPRTTTTDICYQYVKPSTLAVCQSLWEVAHASYLGCEEHLAEPTCFVSHAWSYRFATLVSIIQSYDRDWRTDLRQSYFLDLFTMNQHDLAESSTTSAEGATIHDVLLRNLTKAISAPGRVLLAMDPWKCPAPLERCWCLYEIYIAHATDTKLVLQFSQDAVEDFLQQRRSGDVLEDLINQVDARRSKATCLRDQEMILECIETIGMDSFNKYIHSKLMSGICLGAMYGACSSDRPLGANEGARIVSKS